MSPVPAAAERATSNPALNVLGMSLCDLLQNRCTEMVLPKPVGKDFPILALRTLS